MKKIVFVSVAMAMSVSAEQECNPNMKPNTPNERFIISGMTATDKVTGLTWMRCAIGKTGVNCEDIDQYKNGVTWSEALAIAQQYASKGWRLPNVKELQTITERSCRHPEINTYVFPGMGFGDNFWSSTPEKFSDEQKRAWMVNFSDGWRSTRVKDYNLSIYVRLVRGGFMQ